MFFGQVGDRPFTDIVYGNRNGFLTVLTEPLSRAEEPFIVRQVGFCLLFLYCTLWSADSENGSTQLCFSNCPENVCNSVAKWSYYAYLQVRRLELALLKRWLRKGLKPVDHGLVSDVTQFVKDPSDL